MRSWNRAAIAGLGLAVVVLFMACGGEEPASDSEELIKPVPTATPTVTAKPPGTFERLLSAVPDHPDNRGWIRMIDFDGIRGGLGIEPPGPNARPDDISDHIDALIIGTGEIDNPRPLFSFDTALTGLMLPGITWNYRSNRKDDFPVGLIDTVGFDIRNIEGALYTNGNLIPGPDSTEFEIVLSDAIEHEQASKLLTACEVCPDHETHGYASVNYFRWGEDGVPNLPDQWAPPFHDSWGNAGQLLLGDGIGARSLRTDVMQQIVDTVTGSPSLASNGDYFDAVVSAQSLGAVSLSLSQRSFEIAAITNWFREEAIDSGIYMSIYPPVEENDLVDHIELVESLQNAYPMPRFRLSATGIGLDNGRPFQLFVLVFDDEASAARGEEALAARAGQLAGQPNVAGSGTIRNVAWLRLDPAEDEPLHEYLLQSEIITEELGSENLLAFVTEPVTNLFVSE